MVTAVLDEVRSPTTSQRLFQITHKKASFLGIHIAMADKIFNSHTPKLTGTQTVLC